MSAGLTTKYKRMPDTVEEWKHLVDICENAMLEDKKEISLLKRQLNRRDQQIKKLKWRLGE